ncbi:MAG TPA: hypothetical protein VF666_04315 [Pyrinomonadaceae bacterium]|jgi:hypothetical protein
MAIPIPGNPFEIKSNSNQTRKIAHFYNSEAYLAGIFAHTAKLDGNFDPIIDVLSTRKNNFFRHYLTNYFLYIINDDTPPIPTPDDTDQRKRYSPFLWLDDREKWDLTKYNDNYFARLKRMLASAAARGVVVQLTLFDGAGMRFLTRWPYNPWNEDRNINNVVTGSNSAMPSFYTDRDTPALDSNGQPTTTLGKIQDAFIAKVVTETLGYWNVVFEIMNEPTGGTPAIRARWADIITGVINNYTKGRRLIFYNDHSFDPAHPKGGQDVNAWKTLPNYKALDGVIFHGDPNNFLPDSTPAWEFTADKLIQASSDTHNEVQREERIWNRDTTTRLFSRHIIFQAEAGKTTAADGIGQATPPPTKIFHAPFFGNWNKISTDAPHFHLQFNANGRYFAITPAADTVTDQGRIVRYTDQQFVTRRDGGTNELTFAYTLSPDGQELSYANVVTGRRQTFRRYAGDIEPFLYGWKKVGESSPSATPVFLLYFRQDNTFVARDIQNFQNILNQGHVIFITNDPPHITFHSTTHNSRTPYAYAFYNNGRSLRLTNLQNGRIQDFSRTTEGLPV